MMKRDISLASEAVFLSFALMLFSHLIRPCRHSFRCAVSVSLVWLLPALSFAQETKENGGDKDWIILSHPPITDIVTVTDQYRSYLSSAHSIDKITKDEIDTIVHPAEALNRKAGVNIHRGSGQEHLTAIRSPVLTGGSGAGSFLYLQDGVPLRAAGFANVNGLFEAAPEFAEQIEIFKGPGPAQYGSNAVHGLINFVSGDVGRGSGVTLIGSSRGYGRFSLGADVSNNLRASLSLAHDDGFRADSGFDQQKFQLRYSAEFGSWDVDWISNFSNLNQETAGFIQGDDAYRDIDIVRSNPNPEAFRDGKSYRTQAKLTRDWGGGELVLTPYARRAELWFLRHFVPGQALEKNTHSSVGLQSKFIGDGWSFGLDGEYTKGAVFEFQENPSRFSFVQGLHFDYEIEAIVGAAYGAASWNMTDHLRVDIGARAEYTNYEYNNRATSGTFGRFIRAADRADDFFTLTPKLGLVYEIEKVTVFARAARGSRAPQITDLYSAQQNQVPGQAKVETLDSLEAGFRIGRLIELSAYTMWKDNFFFRNANGFNVVNGKTRHTGVELSFQMDMTDWLYASGEANLARHSYNFDEPNANAANNIANGARIDTAPDTLATMRLGVKPSERLSAEIEWRHVGRYFTDPGNTQTYPGHDIFVLRADYQASDHMKVFGRVDNIFDTRYADRADFAFGNERYFPGRPRTLFFGLSSEF